MQQQQHYDIVFVSSKQQKGKYRFFFRRTERRRRANKKKKKKRPNLQFYYWLHFLYICQLLQTTNKQHVQFMSFFPSSSLNRIYFKWSNQTRHRWCCCCRCYCGIYFLLNFAVRGASNIVWLFVQVKYCAQYWIQCKQTQRTNPFHCDWFAYV